MLATYLYTQTLKNDVQSIRQLWVNYMIYEPPHQNPQHRSIIFNIFVVPNSVQP